MKILKLKNFDIMIFEEVKEIICCEMFDKELKNSLLTISCLSTYLYAPYLCALIFHYFFKNSKQKIIFYISFLL